ncbi:MAG: PIN domain-containing protein [Candidatus Nanohalobium sp.]
MTDGARTLIDTNVLVYSINSAAEERKRNESKEIMAKGFRGENTYYVALQSLEEFITVVTSAIQEPVSYQRAREYIQTIAEVPNFKLLETGPEQVLEAAEMMENGGKDYWDCIIASVAKQNEVEKIITENTQDFKDLDIEAENPFIQ